MSVRVSMAVRGTGGAVTHSAALRGGAGVISGAKPMTRWLLTNSTGWFDTTGSQSTTVVAMQSGGPIHCGAGMGDTHACDSVDGRSGGRYWPGGGAPDPGSTCDDNLMCPQHDHDNGLRQSASGRLDAMRGRAWARGGAGAVAEIHGGLGSRTTAAGSGQSRPFCTALGQLCCSSKFPKGKP